MSVTEDTQSLSINIKEEIVELARTLADTQSRLQRVVAQLEQGEQSREGLDARYQEIEKKYNEAVNGAKWLTAQNSHLQERLTQYQPEFDRALSAREGAFKKLKHARKVIRDLLQERGDMSSPRTQGSLTSEEIAEALGEDPEPEHSSSSSGSSTGVGSDKTVRLHPRTPSASPPNVRPSPQHATRQTSPESSRGSPPWQIYFTKPPGSAVVLKGPLQLESLQSSLGLADETMLSLESLRTSVDISIRLFITRLPSVDATVAFIYDPILIDTRKKTYVCDWGSLQTNQNVEKYILNHKAIDPVFHVFTYPAKEKNWYYVGAMEWDIATMKNLWPLEGNSRTKIINKLCRRSRGEIEMAEMTELLDTLKLKQLCVDLKGVENPKISQDFARDVLGLETRLSEGEGL